MTDFSDLTEHDLKAQLVVPEDTAMVSVKDCKSRITSSDESFVKNESRQ